MNTDLWGFPQLPATIEPVNSYQRWRLNAKQTVSQDPSKLSDPWFANDREIVETAIKVNPFALRLAPNFKNDRHLVLLAVSINGLARILASEALQNDPEIRRISEENIPESFTANKIKNHDNPVDYTIYFSDILKNKPMPPLCHRSFFIERLNEASSDFIRDSGVTLFEGKRLFPYCFKNTRYQNFLIASLPSSANHFLKHDLPLTGSGYFKRNRHQAMIYAYEHNLSFRVGKTCVEWGNCFLFESPEKKRKAIVGIISLFLSMMALEEQNYFYEKTIELKGKPSIEAIRIARNQQLFHDRMEAVTKIKSCSTPEQKEAAITEFREFYKLLMAPVTNKEILLYSTRARRIEVKIALTKACIAEELEISLENIAFIPQVNYHLDTEMFITPGGKAVINDDVLVQKFVDNILASEGPDLLTRILLNEFKTSAKKREKISASMSAIRSKILAETGIESIPLPAVFEAPNFQSALNYCNGIFTFQDKHSSTTRRKYFNYITTGACIPQETYFHRRYSKFFKKTFPDIELTTIPLSDFVSKTQGGIRCLTFENYAVTDLNRLIPRRRV